MNQLILMVHILNNVWLEIYKDMHEQLYGFNQKDRTLKG